MKQLFPMANSILLTTKAAKGKKGTIVATITGTKAQTVVAIIEKHKRRNTVSEII
jgi:hypothetical protein